jgi:2-polyprenyl-3-methyl-5-hydroxy-6-metoxy-1,4-benzoquinol methylase
MQLRVSGLSLDTVNEDLMPLFSAIGTVELITVIRDIISGKSKGYAIVWIPNNRVAMEGVSKLNGTIIKGSQITVSRMPEIMPGEMEFREWLADNANTVLREIGLREGQTILDYGCGPGIFTIPAAEIAGAKGTVYAFDVRPQPLERVRGKAENAGLTNIRTILAENSSLSTGLQDESTDVILVFDMMHAVIDKQGLLKELHRVLKKNGFLSVFPMHLGTVRLLEIIEQSHLFCLRDRFSLPGYRSPSEVVNFIKYQR